MLGREPLFKFNQFETITNNTSHEGEKLIKDS